MKKSKFKSFFIKLIKDINKYNEHFNVTVEDFGDSLDFTISNECNIIIYCQLYFSYTEIQYNGHIFSIYNNTNKKIEEYLEEIVLEINSILISNKLPMLRDDLLK